MWTRLKSGLLALYFSFPVQLLLLHFKKNQVLLAFWVLLFAIITGNFGKTLGVPFLFLDPEYLNEVGFVSFLMVGVSVAWFSISFIITSYILDAQRFNFVGWLTKPFSRFSLNNSVLPIAFVVVYIYEIVSFQKLNEEPGHRILTDIAGFLTGFVSMVFLLYLYFRLTNKDIFKFVVCKLDEKIKESVRATRGTVMDKVNISRKRQVKVDNFLDFNLKPKKVPDYRGFYDRATLLQVFDQNHFNLITVELAIFVILLIVGIFADINVFQVPAASSGMMLLSVLVMFTGAFSYWFRGWSITLTIVFLLVANVLFKFEVIHKSYAAFGIDYGAPKKEYSYASIREANTVERRKADIQYTTEVLENWKARSPNDSLPRIVFVCASGGGQRAMLWALNAIQAADSITKGELMKKTALMTGASGGLFGLSYFRELVLQRNNGQEVNPYDPAHLEKIARDNLNPIILTLLVNDLFLGFQKFEYDGKLYNKDRGYAFEERFNDNTDGLLDKKLSDYQGPEYRAEIPMLLMAPTLVNDGRKLYISPGNISYMNQPLPGLGSRAHNIKGIEFRRFFGPANADGLRFLSGLRMSATFPYITPNVTLPSEPPIEIMDAGLTDNFGIADAARFLYIFKDWISKNTSGVVFLSIRDSQKLQPVEAREKQTLFQKFFSPIQGLYGNFEKIQDINNDTWMEQAQGWYPGEINTVYLEYNSANNPIFKDRASLNWRLTAREKRSIIENIGSEKNQGELRKLEGLLK